MAIKKAKSKTFEKGQNFSDVAEFLVKNVLVDDKNKPMDKLKTSKKYKVQITRIE